MRSERKFTKNEAGSLTVEAALVLPLFLCVILTISTIIRIYQTHETIQAAIDETATSISKGYYFLYAGGDFLNSYIFSKIPNINLITFLVPDIPINIGEEAEGVVGEAAEPIIESFVLSNIIRISKERIGRSEGDPLERLHIVGGAEGLDVASTDITENYIDIVVAYKIKIPLPLQILGEIPVVNRSKARLWRGGGSLSAPTIIPQE